MHDPLWLLGCCLGGRRGREGRGGGNEPCPAAASRPQAPPPRPCWPLWHGPGARPANFPVRPRRSPRSRLLPWSRTRLTRTRATPSGTPARVSPFVPPFAAAGMLKQILKPPHGARWRAARLEGWRAGLTELHAVVCFQGLRSPARRHPRDASPARRSRNPSDGNLWPPPRVIVPLASLDRRHRRASPRQGLPLPCPLQEDARDRRRHPRQEPS